MDAVDATLGQIMPEPTGKPSEAGSAGGYLLGYFSEVGGNGTLYYTAKGNRMQSYADTGGLYSVKKWDIENNTTLYGFYTGGDEFSTILDPNFGKYKEQTYADNFVEYDYNNGADYPNFRFKISDHEKPTRYGYIFTGYYESLDYDNLDEGGIPTATGDKYIDENMIPLIASVTNPIKATKDLPKAIHAGWDRDESIVDPSIEYDVTLNYNYTDSPQSQIVKAKYGETLQSVPKPTRDGYDFLGFYANSDGSGTMYYDGDMKGHVWDKESNGTIYAKWQEKDTTGGGDNNGNGGGDNNGNGGGDNGNGGGDNGNGNGGDNNNGNGGGDNGNGNGGNGNNNVTDDPVNNNGSWKLYLIIGISVGVLLIGGGVYFFLKKKGGNGARKPVRRGGRKF